VDHPGSPRSGPGNGELRVARNNKREIQPVFAGVQLGLGRLPGDIVIERDNFTFYLPITTSILVSVVLSVILWLLGR